MALMEAITLRTAEGDVLDALVHARYGRTDGPLERVLAANPVLEGQGPALDIGLILTFPADVATPAPTRRRLWN